MGAGAAPVPLDIADVATAYLAYYLPLLWVSWLVAFGTTWMDRGFARRGLRGPKGPLGTGRFTWAQSLGLALVLFPFVKFAYGVWASWSFLVDPDSVAVAMTVPALYAKFAFHAVQYFLVPLLGLLLVFRVLPRRRGARPVRGVAQTFRRVGAGVRVSWTHDLMHGLWLFAVFLVVYALSLTAIARIDAAAGGTLSSGDDSRVFDNMTVPLVFLLALVAGVSEEFLFRGVMLTKVTSLAGGGRFGFGVSVAATSLFFGLIHAGYGTWTHVIGPALFGVFEAFVWLRFGWIPAVFVHTGIDVVAFGAEAVDTAPAMEWFLVLFVLASVVVPLVYFTHLHRRRLGRFLGGLRRRLFPLP